MARDVNSSFVGVSSSDVDPNALTRTRFASEAIGDTALVHDLVTGKNTPPTTLDHSGGGAGCPIGLPIVNQIMGREYYTLPHTGSRVLWAVPSVQPAGETAVTIWAEITNGYLNGSYRLEVRNTSWVVVAESQLSLTQRLITGTVSGLTGGTQYFYRLVSDYAGGPEGELVGEMRIRSVFLGWDRIAPDTRALIRRLSADVEDSTELRTKTASSATVIDEHAFDTTETADGRALSGYHTTELARNQHNLAEFITGAPAGTNETRTLAASASQSAFYDHSRQGSEYANAPLLAHVPLVGAGLGIVPEDGGTGSDGAGGFTSGALNAPGWGSTTISATHRSLTDADFWAPRHTTNKLRCQILATSPANTLGSLGDSVEIEVFNADTGASVDTGNAGFTQLGSSNWWWCDISGVDHNPAGANRLRISVAMGSGSPKADGSDLRVVGYTAFLEN